MVVFGLSSRRVAAPPSVFAVSADLCGFVSGAAAADPQPMPDRWTQFVTDDCWAVDVNATNEVISHIDNLAARTGPACPTGTPTGSVTPPNPTGYVTDPVGAHRPDGVDPEVYAQSHSGHCQGGRTATPPVTAVRRTSWAACQAQQLCLASTPTSTCVDSCIDRLLARSPSRV